MTNEKWLIIEMERLKSILEKVSTGKAALEEEVWRLRAQSHMNARLEALLSAKKPRPWWAFWKEV